MNDLQLRIRPIENGYLLLCAAGQWYAPDVDALFARIREVLAESE